MSLLFHCNSNLKIRQNDILISCSVDTDESYLSRYAYFAIYKLMSIYGDNDFDKYYWPDFFAFKNGGSKYLTIINDRSGLDITLRPEYAFFFKPNEKLLLPSERINIKRPLMIFIDKESVDRINSNGIGFCLANTFLFSWHSNHFPFLITYKALLTQDKLKVKSFLGFVITDGESPEYTPMQANLCKISQGMSNLALIVGHDYKGPQYSANLLDAKNLDRFKKLFLLWQEAIQFLVYMTHTHHLCTFGFRNIKMKPKKKDLLPCSFSYKIPKIYFTWKENGDYYELEYKFKVDNIVMTPNERNTAFFINDDKKPNTFYLFDNVSDCLTTMFFAERKFKIFVLRAHYEKYFKHYLDQLRMLYEVKDLK